MLAVSADLCVGSWVFREPRKLAVGSNTASSKAATHSPCRCEAGQRRNARERSTVTAAMTPVIQRVFVKYVIAISGIEFISLLLPCCAPAHPPNRSTLEALWD